MVDLIGMNIVVATDKLGNLIMIADQTSIDLKCCKILKTYSDFGE